MLYVFRSVTCFSWRWYVRNKDISTVLLMYVFTDCVICLWKFNGEGDKVGATKTAFASSGSGVVNQESWNVAKILRYIVSSYFTHFFMFYHRGHQQDIYDICWSCDAAKLISASVNHTAVVWDVTQGWESMSTLS